MAWEWWQGILAFISRNTFNILKHILSTKWKRSLRRLSWQNIASYMFLPISTAIYILLIKHPFILSSYSVINSMKYLGVNLEEKKMSKTYTIKIIIHCWEKLKRNKWMERELYSWIIRFSTVKCLCSTTQKVCFLLLLMVLFCKKRYADSKIYMKMQIWRSYTTWIQDFS